MQAGFRWRFLVPTAIRPSPDVPVMFSAPPETAHASFARPTMGCVPSRAPSPPDAVDACDIFAGIAASDALRERGVAYIRRMERLRIPYLTTPGLLVGFQVHGTWDIFLHFDTDWPAPVSAVVVRRLVGEFEACLRAWLSRLRGFAGFRSDAVRVRVFGFVFERGVSVDDTFRSAYGRHPQVTGWTSKGEKTPWTLSAQAAPLRSQNLYSKSLHLHDVRVTGNRTDTSATFYPQDWSSYVHPEGCRGFQTRYWHGSAHAAFAQRHYLRVGGTVDDYSTGAMTHGRAVLLHEMGHCFFLDDMYDSTKYPRPLRVCGCSLQRGDTIMFGSTTLQPLDHAMLRRSWAVQAGRC